MQAGLSQHGGKCELFATHRSPKAGGGLPHFERGQWQQVNRVDRSEAVP